MKKLMFLFFGASLLLLASCETAGKKSEGTYTGNHTVTGLGTQPGTVVNTSAGDTKVNMNLVCSNLGMNSTAQNVGATLNNNVVTYSYSGSGTNNYDIISIAGTLTDKTLTLTYSVHYLGYDVAGSFSGTKP